MRCWEISQTAKPWRVSVKFLSCAGRRCTLFTTKPGRSRGSARHLWHRQVSIKDCVSMTLWIRTEISKKLLICDSKYTERRVYKPEASSKRRNKNLCPWGLQRVRSTRGKEKIAEWVGLSLRRGGGKDSASLTSSAAPSKT